MAAYAALVSLMHVIEQIKNHPHPPISLDKEQVKSLTEESRIADAAYAAEGIIESHIVNQILAQSTSRVGEKISFVDFYQGLQKVIKEMNFIKEDVMEIKEEIRIEDQVCTDTMAVVSSRSFSMGKNVVVGFDDLLYDIMDKLTRHQPTRQIIPIVGMGGIGKTTLARNAYENSLIVQHFDIRAWATISQECNTREVLLQILLCQNNRWSREDLSQVSEEDLIQMSEEELGETLYKSLCGRRYLIVMDDIWSSDAWDKIKLFLPDNNNGGRIVITTRLSQVAWDLVGASGLKMHFLDEDESWNLLCQNVFGEEGCPPELEQIGKEIARNCKGLPLSIVVIGGLMAKSERTLRYWEYIAKNLNSIVSLEDNERCYKILYTSYKFLPIHLKPCFLYMRFFPEDNEIRVSELIKLWVAEGFLKPICGKSLEIVAEEYLKDLIDRNLVLVSKRGSLPGKIKSCNIHDLLRDLCSREAQKDKFIRVTIQDNLELPEDINTQRLTALNKERLMTVKNYTEPASQFTSVVRSLMCDFFPLLPTSVSDFESDVNQLPPPLNFRLLRVLKAVCDEKQLHHKLLTGYNLDAIFRLLNSRYLAITPSVGLIRIKNLLFPSSVCLIWNLQTLIIKGLPSVVAPSEIWKMSRLRHVDFFKGLYLPDPPTGRDDFVLENLQTLSNILSFKCGEEVVKRIPHVKKLAISYDYFGEALDLVSEYCLNNIGHLQKLESFSCFFSAHLLQNLTLPHSLKKLKLKGMSLHWEEINTKIGSLPLLQVLKLEIRSTGSKWETVEGQFPSLKYLAIKSSSDLECWIAESNHFPCLEHLVLEGIRKLKELPSSIGEISTLQSIQLTHCCLFAFISAITIKKEQKELGNEGFQIRVSQGSNFGMKGSKFEFSQRRNVKISKILENYCKITDSGS